MMRLVLVDDHAIMRDGLRAILAGKGLEVVGEASNGHEAIRLAERLKPDIIVMDISMPPLNGIDATREILKSSAQAKVIVLSMNNREAICIGVPTCRRGGVRGEKQGCFEPGRGH